MDSESPNTTGQQTTTSVPIPTEYELRVVAFLDIMGWRDLVKLSESDTMWIPRMGGPLTYLKLIGELPRSIEDWLRSRAEAAGHPFDPTEGRLQFAQFSDCIVISGTVELFYQLLFQVRSICQGLFYNNSLLLRGAITAGLMYHKGSVAFGPALTAAYDLERKRAIYPRVIIDPDQLPQNAKPANRHQESEPSPLSTWLRQKTDDLWFLSYLDPMPVPPSLLEEPARSEMMKEIVVPYLIHARKMITNALTTYAGEPRINEKYWWLAEYFNTVNREYPTAGVEAIELT